MIYIKTFEDFKDPFNEKGLSVEQDIAFHITHLKSVPKELKDIALQYIKTYTKAKNGKITGLNLHPDIIKKAKEHDLECGFEMGIDKSGYYIHTHRARCHSHETPDKITIKEMKFINSTG